MLGIKFTSAAEGSARHSEQHSVSPSAGVHLTCTNKERLRHPTIARVACCALQTVQGGKAEAGLAAADKFWSELCNSAPSDPPEVILEVSEPISNSVPLDEVDVIVLGGTLGIFLATALQRQGRSVAVLERNRLLGREQEWNISRADMAVSFLLLAFLEVLLMETKENTYHCGFLANPCQLSEKRQEHWT